MGQLHNTLWERVLCGTFFMDIIISVWTEYINCSYQISNNKTCLIVANVIFGPIQVLECKLNQLVVQGPIKDHKYVLCIVTFILRSTTPHSLLLYFVSFWRLKNSLFKTFPLALVCHFKFLCIRTTSYQKLVLVSSSSVEDIRMKALLPSRTLW